MAIPSDPYSSRAALRRLSFSAVVVSQSRGRRPLACARRTAYQPIPVKMTAESPSKVLPSENCALIPFGGCRSRQTGHCFRSLRIGAHKFAVILTAADRARLHIAHCLMRCCRNRMQTWALGRQHASLPWRSSGGPETGCGPLDCRRRPRPCALVVPDGRAAAPRRCDAHICATRRFCFGWCLV